MRNRFYRAIAGLIALLVVIVGLGAFSSARAADVIKYAVEVNGTKITSENADDVFGDGTVRLDPDTFTLYLNDAKITKGTEINNVTYGIYCSTTGLTITGSAEISGVVTGIFVEGALDLNDADIDIDLDLKNYAGFIGAIFTDTVRIKGSTLDLSIDLPENIDPEKALTPYAIFCQVSGVAEISDSEIKSDGGFYRSLDGDGYFRIENSKIDMKSIEGAYPSGGILIADSEVNLEATGAQSNVITTSSTLKIVDSQVTLKSRYSGVRARSVLLNGETAKLDIICSDAKSVTDEPTSALRVTNLLVDNGKLIVKGAQIGIVASYLEVSGEAGDIYAKGSELSVSTTGLVIKYPLIIRYPKNAVIKDARFVLDGKDVLTAEFGTPHVLTLVPYKAPTLTSEGNKAYYTCSFCDNWYWDSEGAQRIEDHSSVIIPKLTPTPTSTPTPTPTSVPATATPKATPTTAAKPTAPGSTATPASKPSAAPTGAVVSGAPTAAPSKAVTPIVDDPKTQILAFVERIYIYVLDREPETEGAAFWSEELYAFRRTGAEVAQGFIFSDEFINRNTSDKEFVTILYKTFFGRDPEEDGMNFWLGQLSSGAMDRVAVANGFIYSQEWADTCASYGIRSGGDLKPTGKIAPTDLTYAFVERMYTTAMGRGYDEEGKQYWASELANFNITGEQCGASFFLSAEMEGYGLSDKDFLGRLYATFMNREADSDGEAYWLSQMSSGVPRADVVFGFTRSPEFTDKCVEARILPY